MSALEQIVQITISKDTATVSRVGFGIPAMLTFHTDFPELARLFGSLDEITSPTGPFTAGSREHQIATAIFAQDPKPAGVVSLRRATAPLRDVEITPITDATAGKPQALTAYSIALGVGALTETFSFTTDSSPIVTEITAGLVGLINAGTLDVLATDTGPGTSIQIESASAPGGVATAGVPFTMAIDRRLMTQIDNTLAGTIVADLTAARAVNDDWYGLVTDAQGKLELDALSVNIETLKKIMIGDSADDEVIDVVSTDVASSFQTAALIRSAVLSHPIAHSSPSGGWMGKQLPTTPGSTTWKFKTLATILAQSYTAAEIANLDGKNANYYTPISGLNTTIEGKMGGGEFIDITRGIDWLEARIKEDVFRVLMVNPKVPFTDLGIQLIVNAIEGVLRQGVTNKLIAASPPFFVTAPRAADVNLNDKASRLLPDITFQATLAGAVHKTVINGRVTV